MGPPVDRKTIDRLVVEHLPAALRFALRLTGDPQIAEDVVQEALCWVLRRWRTFRGEASFGTWMLQIVVNVDRDRRRQQRNVLPIAADEPASTAASPVAEAAANELYARVFAEIHRLPERQREVAVLSLGEGLPARQVAHLLETKDEAVRLPAALVLGHANGPDVTRALIARVTDEPSKSKEAWIALMVCRGKSAESFLAYAVSRPQLLGQVNRARMWWMRMSL